MHNEPVRKILPYGPPTYDQNKTIFLDPFEVLRKSNISLSTVEESGLKLDPRFILRSAFVDAQSVRFRDVIRRRYCFGCSRFFPVVVCDHN